MEAQSLVPSWSDLIAAILVAVFILEGDYLLALTVFIAQPILQLAGYKLGKRIGDSP